MRVNVSLPDELVAAVRDRLPGLNVSRALQVALAELLDCHHEGLACSACGEPLHRADVVGPALEAFYDELLERVERLVYRVGTAEGAARAMRDVALRHGIGIAAHRPLPRPTRAERQLALDLEHEAAS